jgi:transposase
MLCWIFIFGGLLIMMGQHDRSEALFYYFRLEDHVPENHLLRLIEKHISFAFVRERLKASYSESGRPSIDPELLLRILLIGYLYGITSERKLVEELRMHLAWRWSLASAQTEVRAGAVLPGSGGPELQTTGAVPQPTANTYY